MNAFSIRYFHEDKSCEVSKYINNGNSYAENLMISICEELEINPQSRHLFGLYHSTNKIWISNNEMLINWKETPKFEFRIRFRPFSISKLKMVDVNAFYYYFQQMRYDFINGKFTNTDIVYGLAVTDMVREILKKNVAIDAAIDCLDLSLYLPVKSKTHKMILIKRQIHCALLKAWNNSNKDIDFVIQQYMELFLTKLVPDYGIETYEVMFDNHSNVNEVEIQYKPFDCDGISIKSIHDTRNVWNRICLISDLCFISIHKENKTVEIARKNGIPFYLNFKNDLVMKSFVSLLDGYYRLTEKWSFNICKDLVSPSLDKLKRIKCHGPVTNDFAYNKLKEKGNNSCGTYILRESMTKFNQYKLDVIIRNEFYKTFKIDFDDNQFIVEGIKKSFVSLSDVLSHLMIDDDLGESVIMLKYCLPSSEYDQPYNLLLCKPQTLLKSKASETNHKWPPIIPTNTLKLSNTTLTNNSRYGVRLAALQKETVIVKEVKCIDMTNEFLKTVSQWAHLRSDAIVCCKGVTLNSPLSLILEYLQMGPLDTYLKSNQPQIKVVDLIETVTYLAKALWYLQENGIIHGHIRCHNLFVTQHTTNSLKVKLSDPISDNDVNQERAWLPPEYLNSERGERSFDECTHALDVWSFGTTVWQIFSYGDKPSCEVIDLIKPNDCPNEVWTLITECWIVDCDNRKQPHSIVRDINQILYEVFNSRRTANHYSSPIYDSKKPKLNVFKSIFGSQISISSGSLISGQTTDTYLPGNDSLIGSEIGMPTEPFDINNIYTNNEPWLIEGNQLKLGKVLGEGCYGEVLKAVLTHCAGLKEEVVAVKRIKSLPSEDVLRDMKREIEIMKKLSHKNIVEIKGFVEEPQTMLVMEYVELGSLVSYLQIHKSIKHISIPLIKFASDIAKGMEYLESKSIIHRDLAARNILVASQSHVKISDFGLAQFIDPNDQYYFMKTQRELPLRWYAPESLKFFRFSHKSDIWSFGVVLWEMFSYGTNPVYDGDVPDSELLSALELGKRLSCPTDCPLEVYNIMKNCWHNDSHMRPTFTELKHSIEEFV